MMMIITVTLVEQQLTSIPSHHWSLLGVKMYISDGMCLSTDRSAQGKIQRDFGWWDMKLVVMHMWLLFTGGH